MAHGENGMDREAEAPSQLWRKATVRFDLDLKKLSPMYIDLRTRPAPGSR